MVARPSNAPLAVNPTAISVVTLCSPVGTQKKLMSRVSLRYQFGTCKEKFCESLEVVDFIWRKTASSLLEGNLELDPSMHQIAG